MKEGLDPDLLNREAGFGLSGDFSFGHNYPGSLNAGLRHLLLSSWRLQQDWRGSSREVELHSSVRRAIELLNLSSLDDDLESFARESNVSAFYLSGTFRRQVGVTLTRYLNSIRLGRFGAEYRKPDNDSLLNSVLEAGGAAILNPTVYSQKYTVQSREIRFEGRGELVFWQILDLA